MKRKIIGILCCMLIVVSTITTIIYTNDIKVKASGGGQQGGQGDIGLDFQFVWNMSKNFSEVVHKANWSKTDNGIPRGREWATEGENYTITNILYPNMGIPNNPCGLTNYTNLSIGPLQSNLSRKYSSKIVIKDYNLTINSSSQLALDTIFNGRIRASDLTHGAGIYRVYAAFRDPEGNILKTNTGSELKAWWQFSKT